MEPYSEEKVQEWKKHLDIRLITSNNSGKAIFSGKEKAGRGGDERDRLPHSFMWRVDKQGFPPLTSDTKRDSVLFVPV